MVLKGINRTDNVPRQQLAKSVAFLYCFAGYLLEGFGNKTGTVALFSPKKNLRVSILY